MILLDTHVLIWLAREPKKLSKKAADAISQSSREGGLGIAAITLWELAWLAAHGRLAISGTGGSICPAHFIANCNPANHPKNCRPGKPVRCGLSHRSMRLPHWSDGDGGRNASHNKGCAHPQLHAHPNHLVSGYFGRSDRPASSIIVASIMRRYRGD